METKELETKEFFEKLKKEYTERTPEEIDKEYHKVGKIGINAKEIGQVTVMEKVLFELQCLNKERKSIEKGYKDYTSLDKLFTFINGIKDETVILDFLEGFPREVPEKNREDIKKVQDLNIFDDFLIVYTDYTGEIRSQVSEEKREKDPIVFGCFRDATYSNIYPNIYYITDWEDEYCDLTLEKYIKEYKKLTGDTPMDIRDIEDVESILERSIQENNQKKENALKRLFKGGKKVEDI